MRLAAAMLSLLALGGCAGPSAGVPDNRTCVSDVRVTSIIGGMALMTVTGKHRLQISTVGYAMVGSDIYPQQQVGGVTDIFEAGDHWQGVGVGAEPHRVYVICGRYVPGEEMNADTFSRYSTRIVAVGR